MSTIFRRGSRTSFAVALVAAAIATLCGCAFSPSADPSRSGGFDAYLEQLRALPGVDAANTGTPDGDGATGLAVDLDESVTEDQLAAIGSKTAEFSALASTNSTLSRVPNLRLGSASYAYFSGVDSATLDEQLRYWLALNRCGGAQVVSFSAARTLTAGQTATSRPLDGSLSSGGASASEPAAPTTTVTTSVPARLALISLGDHAAPDRLADSLRTLSAVAGADVDGEWGFLDLADHTSSVITSTGFPTPSDIEELAGIGSDFSGLTSVSGLQLRLNPAHPGELDVDLAVFPSELDGASSTDAAARLQSTKEWTALLAMVTRIDAMGVDFRINVLTSSLRDGGNLDFTFGVSGCTFSGDTEQKALTDAIGRSWLAQVSAQRQATAGPCQLS